MRILSAERRRIKLLLLALVIKAANDFGTIIKLYLGSLLLGGLSFALLEGRSIGDGLWWAVVTALTIGYGDLSPQTGMGRIVAAIFQHFWAYGMIPLIAVNLLTHVVRDKDKFTHDEQEHMTACLGLILRKLVWMETAVKAVAAKQAVELPPSPTSDDSTD